MQENPGITQLSFPTRDLVTRSENLDHTTLPCLSVLKMEQTLLSLRAMSVLIARRTFSSSSTASHKQFGHPLVRHIHTSLTPHSSTRQVTVMASHNYKTVVLGGGAAAGYVAKAFNDSGKLSPNELLILGEESVSDSFSRTTMLPCMGVGTMEMAVVAECDQNMHDQMI